MQTALNLITGLVLFYLKFITQVVIVYSLASTFEASRLLNKKSYPIGKGFTNQSLHPTLIAGVGKDDCMSDLLYKTYKQTVFDKAYNMVLYGKFYFLRGLS